MIIICDCGDELALPESFFDGGAHSFWRQHGHFPGAITFICDCGAALEGGPLRYVKDDADEIDAYLAALHAVAVEGAWCREHQACR